MFDLQVLQYFMEFLQKCIIIIYSNQVTYWWKIIKMNIQEKFKFQTISTVLNNPFC